MPKDGSRPSVEERARRDLDLIVIGAGINGAGIARDAAMRGLRVLLLDRGDVGGATTTASTRLIHGGLRYLEHGEVGLVRESLRERRALLRIAPHLVRPLPFLIPLYAGARRGPLTIRAGLTAYDLLSRDGGLPPHHMLDRADTLRREPGLDPRGLRGAALYHDAQVTFPERLALENALSARDHGASVLTYARVDDLLVAGGCVRGVRFTDLASGDTHEARAPVTVNAAGPWVDRVLDSLGPLAPRRLIGGTRGSHLVVDPFPGAPGSALYVEARADGRPFFIIPWDGRYLIGTTDLQYEGSLDDLRPDVSEIAYLLAETNRVVPAARLGPPDVRFAYAGVRPLPYVATGDPGGITRRHVIHDHEQHAEPASQLEGLLSIVGGKLTTYRALAEEVTDRVFVRLGRSAPPCPTALVPLPGANTRDFAAFARDFVAHAPHAPDSGLEPATAARLVRLYGTFAREVLRLADRDPALGRPLSPASDSLAAEVPFALTWELARHLEDVLMRRTMLGLDDQVGLDVLDSAADVAGRALGWDAAHRDAERRDYRQAVARLRPVGGAAGA
ncbi:MAG TPA: glycerol-3-phosphate dehydrogenase/oxidase [Thermomicrobiaceae bacterium]|nr:glycerol-3-phosphate dehydrogenase/oxidase [Thermomicrobiaceae bacterium]